MVSYFRKVHMQHDEYVNLKAYRQEPVMSETSRPVLTLNRKPKAEPGKNKETPIQPVFRRKQRIDAVPRPKKTKRLRL
ncbi:hypothetical protein UA45_08085 [Morganella morganii]|uniref:Uncharacterized protein n=1 Tax=Morganella morganii TaxID=582 RepID=A0A0D8L8J6_MORMO|nr:hypothetical protein UA45_08085 [Morganella morganii]